MFLPTCFLMVSDMLFMELVATDLVMNGIVTLRIFNGFMRTDEDLHTFLVVLGLEALTGRGMATPESIQKEMSTPLESSKKRMTATAVDIKSIQTDTIKEAEGNVLRELNGLKKEKKNLQRKNM